jgi:hypothetical protein
VINLEVAIGSGRRVDSHVTGKGPILRRRMVLGRRSEGTLAFVTPDGIGNSLMSALGLVSRVTPVQTAMRNCPRDEGRSFEVGNQVSISSHRRLLSSKARVVNVAEKLEQEFDRYD